MHKLCFIHNETAYFTSILLQDQWGDDWNDGYYQDNAGPPYGDDDTIIRVKFEGEYYYPPDPLSVQQINQGFASWLASSNSPNWFIAKVYAGISLEAFIDFIHDTGGKVFLEHRAK